MRKLTLLLFFLFGRASYSIVFGDSQNIPMCFIKESQVSGGSSQVPPRPWYITQDDHVFALSATPVDYVLQLLDEDGVVVYFDYIPAGTTQIILPATLSGEFEFRLVADTYYYRGFISI